jgi:hypothetical protein
VYVTVWLGREMFDLILILGRDMWRFREGLWLFGWGW